MPIRFQHQDDVPLRRAPLVEVVAQVRFSPLLKIVAQLPSDFHDRVRRRFPKFTVRPLVRIEQRALNISTSNQLPNEYIAGSADGNSEASLGVDFVALTTQAYSHWQEFAGDLTFLFQAFNETYGPILATRIGLRYINELTAENTGAQNLTGLLDILHEDLTRLYRNESWTLPSRLATVLVLDEGDEHLAMRTAIESGPKERVVLDFDYYKNIETPVEVNVQDLLETLDHYHRVIYDAFRWAIREDRFHIFEPIDQGGNN